VNLVSGDAWSVGRDDDQAEAVVPLFLGVGEALGHVEIADGAVGDEHLVARDHVVPAVFHRLGPVAGHVGPGVRFRIGAGADLFPPADRGDVGLLLLLGAVSVDGLAAEGGGDDAGAVAHIHPGQLLGEHGQAQAAHARPAVGLGGPGGHQAVFRSPPDYLAVVFFFGVALPGHGGQFFLGEFIGHVTEHFHFFRQFEIHSSLLCRVSAATNPTPRRPI
jgi:hypothetical protein